MKCEIISRKRCFYSMSNDVKLITRISHSIRKTINDDERNINMKLEDNELNSLKATIETMLYAKKNICTMIVILVGKTTFKKFSVKSKK